MGWHDRLLAVVASQLPAVSRTKNLAADGSLVHHPDAPAEEPKHRNQGRLLWPSSRNAPGQYLYLARP